MDRGIWCCEYQVTVDLGTIRPRKGKFELYQRTYEGRFKKDEMEVRLAAGLGRLCMRCK